MKGLELVKSSGGVLSRGVIYVDLDRLERYGFVVSWPCERTPSGLVRRAYNITPEGLALLVKLQKDLGDATG